MSQILTWKEVNTRKAHRCFGCAKEYPEKSKMIYSSYADGGTVQSNYWCPVCVEYMHRYFESGDEIGYSDIYSNDREGWEKLKAELIGLEV